MALSKIKTSSLTDYTAPVNKSLVINGAMEVAQRGTSSTTNGYGTVDRFRSAYSGGTVTQSQEDLTSGAPHDLGFHKFMRITNTTAGSSSSSDYAAFYYYTESRDMRTCGWDYVNPNSYLTFSFWARSSLAGTYYTQIINNDPSEQYNHSFTLAANTWTKVEKKIPGYSGLQFNDDTGSGLLLAVLAYYGTNYTASSVNTDEWYDYAGGTQAPDFSQNWRSTASATFDITGYKLELGEEATPFVHRSYAEELRLCERYFQSIGGAGSNPLFSTYGASYNYVNWHFRPTMRATPTMGGKYQGNTPTVTTEVAATYSAGSNYAAWGYNGTYGAATADADI